MPAVHHPFAHMTPRKGSRDRGMAAWSRRPSQLPRLAGAALAALVLIALLRRRSAPPCSAHTAGGAAQQAGERPASSANYAFATAQAQQISANRLAVFVQSWARHSPATKLVILTEPELLEQAVVQGLYADFGVEAVPFEAPPEVDDPEDDEDFRKPGRAALHALEQLLAYMEARPRGMLGVALCASAGEVAVQADPFLHPSVVAAVGKGKVLLTAEGGPAAGAVTVSDSAPTSRAVAECNGKEALDSVGGKALLTSDVVVGGGEAVRQYLRLMVDVLTTRVRHRCLRNPRPDAAALHYAIYQFGADRRLLDFAYVVKGAATSPVFAAAYAFPALLDSQGRVQRAAAEEPSRPPAIVAQYGVHPVLVKHYLNRYRYQAIQQQQLDFAQLSGYIGTKLDRLQGLPESWEQAARVEHKGLAAAESEDKRDEQQQEEQQKLATGAAADGVVVVKQQRRVERRAAEQLDAEGVGAGEHATAGQLVPQEEEQGRRVR